MKNVNPLVIIISLLLILFSIFMGILQKREKQRDLQVSLKKIQELSNQTVSLKKKYQKNERLLQIILNQNNIKKFNPIYRKKAKRHIVEFDKIDAPTFGLMLNKLMNKVFILHRLEIKKIDKNNAYFYVGLE